MPSKALQGSTLQSTSLERSCASSARPRHAVPGTGPRVHMSGSDSTWRALEGFSASSAWRSLKGFCAHSPGGILDLKSVPPGFVTQVSVGVPLLKRNNLLEPPALRALDFSRLGAARLALFSGLTLKVSDMTSGPCCKSGSSYPIGVSASGGSTRPSQLFSAPTVTLSLLTEAESTRTSYLVPVRSKPSHGCKTPAALVMIKSGPTMRY